MRQGHYVIIAKVKRKPPAWPKFTLKPQPHRGTLIDLLNRSVAHTFVSGRRATHQRENAVPWTSMNYPDPNMEFSCERHPAGDAIAHSPAQTGFYRRYIVSFTFEHLDRHGCWEYESEPPPLAPSDATLKRQQAHSPTAPIDQPIR